MFLLITFFLNIDNPKARLIGDRVCRTLGEELLRSHSKYELNEFLRVWQESVPPGIEC